jgi:hypothetical protein
LRACRTQYRDDFLVSHLVVLDWSCLNSGP